MKKKTKKTTEVMDSQAVMTTLRKEYDFSAKTAAGVVYAAAQTCSMAMKHLATKEDISKLAGRLDKVEVSLSDLQEDMDEMKEGIRQAESDRKEDRDEMKESITKSESNMKHEFTS